MIQPIPTPWTASCLQNPVDLRFALLDAIQDLNIRRSWDYVLMRLTRILRCWNNDFGSCDAPNFLVHRLSWTGLEEIDLEWENEGGLWKLKEACNIEGFSLYRGNFVWCQRICEEGPWAGEVTYTACELRNLQDLDGNLVESWPDVKEEDLLDQRYWYREGCEDLEHGELRKVFCKQIKVLVIVPPEFASEFPTQEGGEQDKGDNEEGDDMDVDDMIIEDMEVDETMTNSEDVVVYDTHKAPVRPNTKRRATDDIDDFVTKRQATDLAWR